MKVAYVASPFIIYASMNRQYNIVKIIATALRKFNCQVDEEFYCLDSEGSNGRVDILAYNKDTRCVFIIDPPIRLKIVTFEVHDDEKKRPCVNGIKSK